MTMLAWLDKPVRLHVDTGPLSLQSPVCISASGERVAWADHRRRTVRVNDVETEAELASISLPDTVEVLRDDEGEIVMLCAAAIFRWRPGDGLVRICERPSPLGRLSRTGRWALFEVDGRLLRVDTRDGSTQQLAPKFRGRALDLAISDAGDIVARAVEKSVQVHRVGTKPLQRLEVPKGPTGKGMSVSPDGRRLAVGSGDALFHCFVFDLAGQEPTRFYRDHFDPLYLRDGTLSCQGWHSAGCVLHIDPKGRSHSTAVKMTAHCRSYADDGSRLAVNTTFARTQRVQVLAMPGAALLTGRAAEAYAALAVGEDTVVADLDGRVTRFDAMARARQSATHRGLTSLLVRMPSTTPSTTHAVCGGAAGVALLDLSTLELRWHDATIGRVHACRVLPGGELMAIVSGDDGQRTLHRLDPDTGRSIDRWPLPEWLNAFFIRPVALGWVSVAGRTGVVVLDVAGRPILEWKVPPGGYLADLDEDGRHALVSSKDGDVGLWDVGVSKVVASLAGSERVRRDLAFAGPWLVGAANGSDGVAGFVWSRTGALVQQLDWPVVESAGFIVQPSEVFLTSPTGVVVRYDPS